MKYQVGDEIIVLHSHEEGKVIEIINDKMVLIEVRGVKFPAYMDQIDFPYFYRFTKKKEEAPKKTAPKQYIDNIPKEKPQPNHIKVAEGVWLALIPKFALDDFNDEVVELLKVYLVNKTTQAYQFVYKQFFQQDLNFELTNQILGFHDFYLHDIAFEEVNDGPSFSIDFSLLEPNKKKASHYETQLKLKPKQLFHRIEQMKENNEPTVSYPLFQEYPDKTYEEVNDRIDLSKLSSKGFKVYDASRTREHLPPARSVIDLHIEKLVDDHEGMSNLEIIGIQLSEFEKWFELAIAHRQPSLIVIHGVGSGRLREEIHDILKVKREVKRFVNQYDPRFGHGATEIIFQY